MLVFVCLRQFLRFVSTYLFHIFSYSPKLVKVEGVLRPDRRVLDGTYVITLIAAQYHAVTREVSLSGAARVTQQACNTSNQKRAVFFLFKPKSCALKL